MLSYLLLRIFQSILAILPLKGIYFLSNFLAWILQHIFRYRRRTIDKSLRLAFPEIGDKALKKVKFLTYRNLSDTSLESLIGNSFSAESLKKRMNFSNPEIIPSDQHALLVGGHQGNWEWGGLAVGLWFSQQVVGVYKPLHQKRIDKYFKDQRKKWGLRLLSMRQTYKFLQEKNDPCLLVLIADQSPGNGRTSIWTSFFNRPAAFNVGPEKIAKEMNWPIYFYSVKRKKRGHYEVHFELLEKDPQNSPKGKITMKFRDALEKSISEQPEDWLWSHKRWKKEKPIDIPLFE